MCTKLNPKHISFYSTTLTTHILWQSLGMFVYDIIVHWIVGATPNMKMSGMGTAPEAAAILFQIIWHSLIHACLPPLLLDPCLLLSSWIHACLPHLRLNRLSPIFETTKECGSKNIFHN